MTHISIDELETFSQQSDATAEDALLKRLKSGKLYKTALVVGRFQPLHRGHIYLLRCALRIASSVIICIGSANIVNEDNPIPLQSRIELLHHVLKREELEKNVKGIFALNDSPSDEIWLSEAISKAGTFDVVIGNNDWVNSLFKKAGYDVFEIQLLNREIYEGKTIRKRLRDSGTLK